MSRRHFNAIARILRASLDQPVDYQRDYIADQLAIMCGQENEHFDYDRFAKACAA